MGIIPVTGQISLFKEDGDLAPEGGQAVTAPQAAPSRKKRTKEEEDAIAMMKAATPEMVALILDIARNVKASSYTRLQAAELILNRSMGKPETYLKVEAAEESVEEAAAGLMGLFREAEEEDRRKSLPELAVMGEVEPDEA